MVEGKLSRMRRARSGLTADRSRPRISMGEKPLALVLTVEVKSDSNCSHFSGLPSNDGTSMCSVEWEVAVAVGVGGDEAGVGGIAEGTLSASRTMCRSFFMLSSRAMTGSLSGGKALKRGRAGAAMEAYWVSSFSAVARKLAEFGLGLESSSSTLYCKAALSSQRSLALMRADREDLKAMKDSSVLSSSVSSSGKTSEWLMMS